MENRYKILIVNQNIYKEIELTSDMKQIKIGTSLDCDVRLYKELFFENIELVFSCNDNAWTAICSDNLYFSVGDARKLMTKQLAHGDAFVVKYQESNIDVFKMEFVIDFDERKQKYDRYVNISGQQNITIGASENSDIVVSGIYIKQGDYIQLLRDGERFLINNMNSEYGVYHNGKRAVKGEKIDNGDFFSIANHFFYFKDNKLWVNTSEKIAVPKMALISSEISEPYPMFVRNTRIKTVIDDGLIDILDPPAKPQKSKGNLFMQLFPSFGMLISAGVMAAFGGTTMIIFGGISAAMSIITAIINISENKKEYIKNSKDRIEKYKQYIVGKRSEIEYYRMEERKSLESIYISQAEEKRMIRTFSSDLFDRQFGDDDFLCVMLGNGDVKAKRRINFKKQERIEIEDELQMIPEQIYNEYEYIHDAPVVCNFKESNAIGIVGNEAKRFEIFQNIVIDLATRHYYTDVQMFFIVEKEHEDKIKWLRFLPHTYNRSIGTRNIVCNDESKNLVFEYLYKELSTREQFEQTFPHIVVFLYDEYGFKSHPISRYVSKAKELGVTFVFFGENKAEITVGCDYIIKVEDSKATLINTSNRTELTEFTYLPSTTKEIEELIYILAPIYTEEISLESTLTKKISLFELLNVMSTDDINLKDRWNSTQVYKSMAAPIGVSKTGIVSLDLHDKAHGPHGLVAGTTGSGKSEILQTYILMMATLYNPNEIGFLIIDFKGGGMVNQFKNLPHLLGSITNIDGKEINRSLKSIKAELQKRQRLFAEADVNHIDKYIQKFKSNKISTPLPHLIIIVDEFAELKAEQPDFMKELISAARIGRSLGVHLILATQKPAGQVDDQIWSNSRFKLCLKVQSKEDSNEVIKSPLAAEIKEPGRAYFQVGNNEIFELFQSAYSGAPEKIDDSRIKEFSIYEIIDNGRKNAIFKQKGNKSVETSLTQLEVLVNYIAEYCEKENIAVLDNICLPPLPDVVFWNEKELSISNFVDIGIYDDPDNQVQASAMLDVANKNTLIIGSSQYGKTNLLQQIIKNITYRTTPKESVFYILDFASMTLKNLEMLNHVGGVVTSTEDEKLKNLFKLLFEEINDRKEKLLVAGVSSFSAYIEAGNKDIPHIYIIIDNITALNELYFQDDDGLLTVIREGISVGISVIVANSQMSGIGYKYIASFANRIGLYCNDSNEYSSIFDNIALKPEERPGRCVVEIDKRMLECQTYLAFEGEKEYERVQTIRKYVEEMNKKYAGMKARQIPCIPKTLTVDKLVNEYGAKGNTFTIPIGLTYKEVKPFYLNLYQIGIFGITGRDNYGHKNLIRHIINSVKCEKRNIVIFDDVSRKYSEYEKIVNMYTLNIDRVEEVINRWSIELENRYNKMLLGEISEASAELLMMVIQNNDVATKIQSDYDLLEKFNMFFSKYKNMGVCIIFANFPNKQISYDAPEPFRIIKQNQSLVCLEDIQYLKCIDVPYEAIRDNKKPLSLGDGYCIDDSNVTKIKIVLSDD